MDLLKRRLICSMAAAVLLHAAVFIGIDLLYTPAAAGPSVSPAPMAVHLDEILSDIPPPEETAGPPPAEETAHPPGYPEDEPVTEASADTFSTGEPVPAAPVPAAPGIPDAYRPGSISPGKLERITVRDRTGHGQPHWTDPVPQGRIEPDYPLFARMRGYEGITVIEIQVSAAGRVVQTAVTESSGYDILDEAAINSVRRTAFIPGMIDNDPAEMRVRVKVVFTLQ